MTTLEKSIIGRIIKNGEKFEVILDKDKAYDYMEKRRTELTNMLITEDVFKDAKKGDKWGPDGLKKNFGTNDIYAILKEILEKGEIQLTTEQKHKMQEEKQKKIILLIMQNCLDARTNAPITEKRIELAMEEVRFHVDPFKSPEVQMEEVLSKLKLVLPLKIEKARIAVRVPAVYSSRAYGFLKPYMQREEWASNGDLVVAIEIPAGMQGEFFDKLNKLTHGEVQTKMIEK